MPSISRTIRGPLIATAFATLSVFPVPALAGSYEQVTRLSGAQGDTPITRYTEPLATTDDGRYAVFRSGTAERTGDVFVRDVKTDTLDRIATADEHVLGFNRAGTVMLVARPTADGAGMVYLLRRVGTPEELVLYTADAADLNGRESGEPIAAISGDGNTVAIGLTRLRVITVSTGAVKECPLMGVRLGRNSLSDDGSVIAGRQGYWVGYDDGGPAGFVIRAGAVENLDEPAVVSPDGSVLARISWGADNGPAGLTVRTLATGVERTFTPPTGAAMIAWIAPNGKRIALAPDPTFTDGFRAQQVDTATGQWTAFGGAASTHLRVDLLNAYPARTFPGRNQSAISRNGRYGVVLDALRSGFSGTRPVSSQAYEIDFNGGDLPGAEAPVSPFGYLRFDDASSICDSSRWPTGRLSATLRQPAPWVPKPRSASLTVTVDGETVRSGPLEFATITFAPNASRVTLQASVVDGSGRKSTASTTVTGACGEIPAS